MVAGGTAGVPLCSAPALLEHGGRASLRVLHRSLSNSQQPVCLNTQWSVRLIGWGTGVITHTHTHAQPRPGTHWIFAFLTALAVLSDTWSSSFFHWVSSSLKALLEDTSGVFQPGTSSGFWGACKVAEYEGETDWSGFSGDASPLVSRGARCKLSHCAGGGGAARTEWGLRITRSWSHTAYQIIYQRKSEVSWEAITNWLHHHYSFSVINSVRLSTVASSAF